MPPLPISVLLVHGWWGNAGHWTPTLLALREHIADLTALDIPLTSLADDVARVEAAIGAAAHPVLLVGHSYGGVVITQAGNSDKVKGLVYIAANAPAPSESLSTLAAAYPLPTSADVITSGSQTYIDRAAYRANMAADLPEAEAWAMAASQKPVAIRTAYDTVSRAAWEHKRSWYAVATQDKVVDPRGQRASAERIGAEVVEVEGAHYLPVSRAGEVAALIIRAARAVLGGT